VEIPMEESKNRGIKETAVKLSAALKKHQLP
jgi:hypothetical protein